MIHDIDAALRELIERGVVNGGEIEVDFEVPSREWAAKRNKPTVNVYLFDLREELDRRMVSPERSHRDGRVTGRSRPPRFFRLSYLVTAWTQRPEDEHRLLSAVLHAFLAHERLPDDVLQDAQIPEGLPVHLRVGQPPPAERSIGEIWTALGGELKPSVELVVIAPFDLDAELPVGPPVTETPRVDIAAGGGGAEAVGGGQPTEPADGGDEQAEPLEETITAGTDDDPGRTLTVRSRS